MCVLPGGVFLLLGYSAADEALLRPHTNLGVQDAVRALQQYVTTYINNQVSRRPRALQTTLAPFVTYSNINCNSLLLRLPLSCTQTQCTLTLFNMTEENIIIAARLPHDGKLKDIEVLRREKVRKSCFTLALKSHNCQRVAI